jgi:outer membrane protein assembly factor BamB
LRRVGAWFRPLPFVVAALVLTLASADCAAQALQNFRDGISGILGRPGGIASHDAFEETRTNIKKATETAPLIAPLWDVPLAGETTDILVAYDAGRILVGTVDVSSGLGVPEHGPVRMVDAASGKPLWSSERVSFPEGRYSVLALQPAVVLLGSDAKGGVLLALDGDSGAKRWELRVQAPYRVETSLAGDRLYLYTTEGRRGLLRAIALPGGSAQWTAQLEAESGAPEIQQHEGDLYLVARSAARISAADGSVLWATRHPILGSANAGATPVEQGVVLWNENALALLRHGDGRPVWEAAAVEGKARLVSPVGPRLLRLVLSSGAGDALQAVELASGRVLWKRDLGATVVSPVVGALDLALCVTDDAVLGLRIADGAEQFRTNLPAAVVERYGVPYKPSLDARTLGDMLSIRGQRLLVAREGNGIAALDLPSGRLLWSQGARSDWYATPSRILAIQNEVELRGAFEPSVQQLPAHVSPSQAGQALRSAQADYQDRSRRAHSVRADSRSSGSERAEANRAASFAARRQEVAQQMAMASAGFEGAAATLQFGSALIGGMERVMRQQAYRGMMSRARMETDGAYQMRQASIQGGYYLQPFRLMDAARGVMIVDIETGARSDLVFGALNAPLTSFGIDNQAFAIDPETLRLLTPGVGMNPARHEEIVKWKWRMPKVSLLAYDLRTLKFEKENWYSSWLDLNTLRPGTAPKPLFAIPEDNLTLMILYRQADRVRKALAAGVDPNKQDPTYKTTALHTAAGFNNKEIVQILLEHGADPTIQDRAGKTPGETAFDPEIKQILQRAAAERAARK